MSCLWLLADDGAAEAQCTTTASGKDGDACETALDCGPGLDCTSLDGPGTCRRYCCDLNATAGCPAEQYCRIALVAEGMQTDHVALCDRCDACDPTDPRTCAAGLGCFPLPSPSPCMACLTAGAKTAGVTCAAAMDCAPGTACLRADVDGEQRCREICNLASTTPCGSGRCVATDGAGLPELLGVCLEL